MHIKNHLNMLGMPCKDRVTGVKGVVTSVCFDLYGCVQGILHQGTKPDGTMHEQMWFDIARLERTGGERVMELPNFDFGDVAEGRKGPADKPMAFKS
jgi:hypothetical protein